ncbi:uncharacterized protein E5676_scaffold318G00240 [Cucumis melo var. makuwa]|uniref:Uncharacterized protein n=1 Tax=Cucumis melo var. makuwa TaxID=1194695 RepID=A0A5D3DEE4_CUCMM|nr:uncharacterized protein E6C27_scaffold22G00750 [Cucumis melo var. makuwa]TYK22047.1 uncharacterized protein E5676_scaffold318G00240 [Cucumis melo var. makuwa]
MGCGISRFDPKEVVEATANNSNHKSSYSTSNCFTGESKPLVHQGRLPPPEPRHSSPDRAAPGDQKMTMKIKTNVMREEAKGIDNKDPRMRMRTKTRTSMQFDNDEDFGDDNIDQNDQNCREICRGGSPSFREYCVGSESRSRMGSEDDCEGDHCKGPPKDKTLNCRKEKGVDNEIGKKERRGKGGIMNALQRGKSGGGGVKNLLTSSSRPQQHNTNFSSHQLFAKPS